MKVRVNDIYRANIADWEYYLLSFKGGSDYLNGGFLHAHRFENVLDYRKRAQRAYYLNYVEPIVSIYTKYICGAPLSRTAIDEDKQFFENFAPNCDGKDTPLAEFIKRICNLTSVFGKCGVLVDGSRSLENSPEIGTGLTDQEIDPVLRIIMPTGLVDWSVDGEGKFNWILLVYDLSIDSDPAVPRQFQKQYELWTRDQKIILWPSSKKENKDLTIVGAIQHNLGMVPYCEFKHTDLDEDNIPESMIRDIARINQAIFNYSSLLDEIFYMQTFSQLVIAADAGEIQERIVGTSKIFTYAKDVPFPPTYISPDYRQAEILIRHILGCVAEIYRLATLKKGGTEKSDQYSTAYGKMVDFEDTESSLTEKAGLMEACEKSLSRIVNRWRGKEELLWTPVYPKTFEVQSFAAEVQSALQLDNLGMGDLFMAEYRKRLARRALPMADSDLLERIDTELDSLKFSVPEIDPHFRSKAASVDSPPSSQNTAQLK